MNAGGVKAGERYGEWLATIDLRSPHALELDGPGQPAGTASRDGRRVVFDGLLHNAEGLRRELGLEEAAPADIVLGAFDRWGADLVTRLRGNWALALWDRDRHELLCARDQHGVHPLFYAEADGGLLLSPSIAALVGDPRVPATLNRAALADHLLHRWPDFNETYYEAVRRVPQGHRLIVRDGGRVVERYWSPAFQDRPIEDESAEQQRFDELLEQAVARCLVAPPAIYLSGGLDSVSIAAFATDLAPKLELPTPYALSLVFEDETANEENVQLQVAQGLGLEQTIVPVSAAVPEQGLLASALEMSAERPAPMLNLWNPAYRFLALDGKERGRGVILTGNGGDEWLEFPIAEAAMMIRRGDFAGLYRTWSSMQRSYPLSKMQITRNLLWTYGTKPLLKTAFRSTVAPRLPGIMRARRRRYFERNTFAWVAPDPALRSRLYERLEAHAERESTSQDSAVTALELEEFFESGRQVGMRLLHPLWDVDLTDFIAGLPADLMIRGGRSKALVRRSLARRFPGLGFEHHRKITASSFYASVLVDEGRRVWRDLGGARALAALDIVEPGKLGRYVESLLAGENAGDRYRLWHLLTVEAWVRAQVEGPSRA